MKGEIFAATSAFLWAVAVILFKKSGASIGPVGLNLLKNVLGLLCFLLTFLFVALPAPSEFGSRDALVLAASGVLGIGIADTLFFWALRILGASWNAIVDCFYSPFVILFSFLILGERLTPLAMLGAAMVVASVALSGADKRSLGLRGERFALGVFLSLLSVALMAFSIVIVKPLLAVYPLIWATTLRLAGGTLSVIVAALLVPSLRHAWSAFRPQRAWIYALPGGFVGSYFALVIWVGGFKYAQANIAAVLNQTSTLFIVMLAALFLSEPLTKWKLLALTLGLSGSVLVVV